MIVCLLTNDERTQTPCQECGRAADVSITIKALPQLSFTLCSYAARELIDKLTPLVDSDNV